MVCVCVCTCVATIAEAATSAAILEVRIKQFHSHTCASRFRPRAFFTLEMKCQKGVEGAGEWGVGGSGWDWVVSRRISFFFFFFFDASQFSACSEFLSSLTSLSCKYFSISSSSPCLSLPLQRLTSHSICVHLNDVFAWISLLSCSSRYGSVQFDLAGETFLEARASGGGFMFPLVQPCSLWHVVY